jgi:NAD(P)-dependent dehydrogenase (short-subunit alcohol dehydrogenase family)
MRLAGKVALVTGAQQGIGRAIALAMAGEGADVGLNFLDDPGAAEGAAGEIRALGRRALTVKGDVARAGDVQALVATVTAGLGPPDVLVNNAGVFPRSPFLELSEREWDHVLGVNLKGGFLCAQAVARALVTAGRAGAIVNISSSAVRGDPRGVHYSASKAGVLGLTRAMALALAPHRIRVNAIAPGLVLTEKQLRLWYPTPDKVAQMVGNQFLPDGIEPAEVARLALFLASDDSRMITKQTFALNGGRP